MQQENIEQNENELLDNEKIILNEQNEQLLIKKWQDLFNAPKTYWQKNSVDKFFTMWNSINDVTNMTYFPTEVVKLKRFLDPLNYINKKIVYGEFYDAALDLEESIEILSNSFLLFLSDGGMKSANLNWFNPFIEYIRNNIEKIFTIYNMPNMIHAIFSVSKFLAIDENFNLAFQTLRFYLNRFCNISNDEIDQLDILMDSYNSVDNKLMYIDQLWKIYLPNSSFFLDSIDVKWRLNNTSEFSHRYAFVNQAYMDLHYKLSQEIIEKQLSWMANAVSSHEYFMNRIESYEPYSDNPILKHYLFYNAAEIIPALLEFPFEKQDITSMEFAVYYLTKLDDIAQDLEITKNIKSKFYIKNSNKINLYEVFNYVMKRSLRTFYEIPDVLDTTFERNKIKPYIKNTHKALEKILDKDISYKNHLKVEVDIKSTEGSFVKETDALKDIELENQILQQNGQLIPNDMLTDIKEVVAEVIQDFNIDNYFDKSSLIIDTNKIDIEDVKQNVNIKVNDMPLQPIKNQSFWDKQHANIITQSISGKKIITPQQTDDSIFTSTDPEAQSRLSSIAERMAILRGEKEAPKNKRFEMSSSLRNAEVIAINKPYKKDYDKDIADLLSSALNDARNEPIAKAKITIDDVEGQWLNDDSSRKERKQKPKTYKDVINDMKSRIKDLKK